MNLDRRDCLRLGGGALAAGAGATALLASGCSQAVRRYTAVKTPPAAALPPTGHVEPITRLLNRAAFGPAPGDVARVAALGPAAYVDAQLRPDDAAAEPPVLTLRLRATREVSDANALDLQDLTEGEVLRELTRSSLLRAVYSRHQLRERMVDFWTNHFNIYARKKLGAYYEPTDEERVVRAHALGNFPALLRASARSPAMLGYLDNEANTKGVPNENYARELLELHTLGVGGGYTQKDVQEVARCLTGWTIEDRFLRKKGTFRFAPERHDDGPKTVLGVTLPAGGGEQDGERVLDIVSRHPATARFIAGKLCRYFLGDGDAAREWTPKIAAVFLQTSGDISAMLRPLLLSDALLHGPPILKRPFDFVASALRALNADTDGGPALQSHLTAMGQPLHEWPLPDGYPDTTHAWTGSLLARWNFAFALAGGRVNGTTLDISGLVRAAEDAEPADALLTLTLARRADAEAVQPLRTCLRAHLAQTSGGGENARLAEAAALCLAAPPFQWR